MSTNSNFMKPTQRCRRNSKEITPNEGAEYRWRSSIATIFDQYLTIISETVQDRDIVTMER